MKHQQCIRLSISDISRIDFIAKKQGSNRSAVIRMAVNNLLEVFESNGVFEPNSSTLPENLPWQRSN